MLFRRRIPAELRERLRTALWPRRSFWRSAQYFVKRILRLSATPHAIAAGIAAGIFASFLPFIGFHFVIAAVIAWCVGGNLVASAFGTAVGNPITFPFIWGATYKLGRYMLYGTQLGDIEPLQLGRVLRNLEFSLLWQPLLKPMTAGAIPLGLLAALVFYAVTYWGVSVFQKQRRRRLAEKARRVRVSGSARAGASARP